MDAESGVSSGFRKIWAWIWVKDTILISIFCRRVPPGPLRLLTGGRGGKQLWWALIPALMSWALMGPLCWGCVRGSMSGISFTKGFCLPLPSVSSWAVLSCWDKESWEQLQGQLRWWGAHPFCLALAGAALPTVPRLCCHPWGSQLRCLFFGADCKHGCKCLHCC